MRITDRGIRYIEAAIENWYAREDKLKHVWCNDHEFIGVVTTMRQIRLMRIADELKKRYDLLCKYRHDHLEKIMCQVSTSALDAGIN